MAAGPHAAHDPTMEDERGTMRTVTEPSPTGEEAVEPDGTEGSQPGEETTAGDRRAGSGGPPRSAVDEPAPTEELPLPPVPPAPPGQPPVPPGPPGTASGPPGSAGPPPGPAGRPGPAGAPLPGGGPTGGSLRPSWWHRPLSRCRDGRVLGGVVGGIAARYGWDRRAARLLTVLGALVLPVVVPLYLVAWIVLPADPEPGRAPAELFQGDGRTWIAVGLVVVGVAMFFGGGWGFGLGWNDDLLGAAFLIGLGAWLWSRRPPEPTDHDPAAPAASAVPAAGPPPAPSGPTWSGAAAPAGPPPSAVGPTWPRPGAPVPPRGPFDQPWAPYGPPPPPSYGAPYGYAGSGYRPPPPYGPPLAPAPPPAAPRPAVHRPPVARITAAAALLGLGVAAIGDRIGLFDLDLAAVLALLLGIVGVGLVVGAFIGGGRWLLLPALVLGPLAIGAAMVGSLNLAAGVGEAEVRPRNPAEIGDGLEHGIGSFTVDLRDFEWSGDSAQVPVDLAVGELRVTVPDDVDLVVDAEVAAGQVDALDRQVSGTSVEETFAFDAAGTSRTLRLQLDVGVGHVLVERAGERAGVRAGAPTGGGEEGGR